MSFSADDIPANEDLSHWDSTAIRNFSNELFLHSLRISPNRERIIADLKKIQSEDKSIEPNSKTHATSSHKQLAEIINNHTFDEAVSAAVTEYLILMLQRAIKLDPLQELQSEEFHQKNVNEKINRLDQLKSLIKSSKYFLNKENASYKNIKDPVKLTSTLINQLLANICELYTNQTIEDYEVAVTRVIQRIEDDSKLSESERAKVPTTNKDPKENASLSSSTRTNDLSSSVTTLKLSPPIAPRNAAIRPIGAGFFSTPHPVAAIDIKTPAPQLGKVLTKDSIVKYLKNIVDTYKKLNEPLETLKIKFINFFEDKNNLKKPLPKSQLEEFLSIKNNIDLSFKDPFLTILICERMEKLLEKTPIKDEVKFEKQKIINDLRQKNERNNHRKNIIKSISDKIQLKEENFSIAMEHIKNIFDQNLFLEENLKDVNTIEDALKLLAKFIASHPNIKEEGFIQNILTACSTAPTSSISLASITANTTEKTLTEATETLQKALAERQPPKLKS